MLEQVPISQEQTQSAENGLETPDHLDVAKLMVEKNAFFVHMIQVTKDLNVSENNESGIDTNKLSTADKLDLVYGMNPTLSASTLRPHTNDGTFMGGFGVIFSHGTIESATAGDAGTKATSLTERSTDILYNQPEDIGRAIDRPQYAIGGKTYNEIVLKDPEVAGGFMKLDNYQDRINYEEEESTYYDGEKTMTKIGVIDFNNKLDRSGKTVMANYDKPFSTLLEMSKRGKVFVMDEGNQMYIVKNIDEKNRKVEFVATPINPKSFAESYHDERINKYAKLEMKDRLEKSLQEKGMKLNNI